MIETEVKCDHTIVYEIQRPDRELTILKFLHPDEQKVQRECDHLPRPKSHLPSVEVHLHKVRHLDEPKAVHTQPVPELHQRAQEHVNVRVKDALGLNEPVLEFVIITKYIPYIIKVLIPMDRDADKR